MIDRLNLPTGLMLFLASALPALASSHVPGVGRLVVLEAAPPPLPNPPPPPEVIPGEMSAEIWHHALAAQREAVALGQSGSPTLTVIDYSRPATEKRLWVVDVPTRHLLATEYVAHGEGSGSRLQAIRFSNRDDSHQSSLGTFVTGEMFFGVRGRSLPLHGLEAGINDNAYTRGLLIHGTPTVSEARALQGIQGVTEGCAGVPSKSAKRLISLIGEGSVVFVWYPDPKFLEKSGYLDHEEVEERLGAD